MNLINYINTCCTIIGIITDAKFFILSYGVKETWANFVADSSTDLFSISMSDIQDTIFNLISRMKQGKYTRNKSLILIMFDICLILFLRNSIIL